MSNKDSRFNKKNGKGNKNGHSNKDKKGYKDTNPPKEEKGSSSLPCYIKEIQGGNDFSWYNRNGNLTNIGSSYFLSNPAGKPIGKLNKNNSGSDFAVPGIMRIDMLPAFAPTSTNAEKASVSGLNIAAKQLYARMRKANAGARSQYEAPDLLLYVLAVENIYSFIANCVRAYGYLSQYPTNNRYYVERLITAMGFDYDDLLSNRLQFYNFINTSIMRLRRFVIPAGFSTVNRSVWVNSNIFCDTTSTVKAQLYIPVYNAYWKFNSTGMATGGCLELSYITSTPRTVASLEAYFNQLIAPIAQDDDFLTISGDIMKFTESYFTLEPISENLVLNPIYDEDVMLQLHNLINLGLANPSATTEWENGSDYGMPSDLPYNSTYTIYQKDGLLYFQPILSIGSSIYVGRPQEMQAMSDITEEGTLNYIDTPEDSPSVERVTEATRLITTLDFKEAISPDTQLPIKTCGHEIVVGITLYTDTDIVRMPATYTFVGPLSGGNWRPDLFFRAMTSISAFEWDVRLSAHINYVATGGSDTEYDLVLTHWNTRSIGTFDVQSFTKLNDIITMSLLTLV